MSIQSIFIHKRYTHHTLTLIITACLVLVPATTGASTAPQASRAGESSAFTTLFLPWNSHTRNTTIRIDPAAGVHVAYEPASGDTSGTYWAYYAYCASACHKASSWSALGLDKIGFFGGHVTLALTKAGQPRMLWRRQNLLSEQVTYVYALCDTQCSQDSNWHIAPIKTASSVSDESALTLDLQDRPRFVHTNIEQQKTGTYYASCDADCSIASNWKEGQISPAYLLYEFALSFDSSGNAHLAYRNAVASQVTVDYAICQSSCGHANQWSDISLAALGSGSSFQLKLDSAGQPHLALFSGYFAQNDPANNLLHYAWCHSDCLALSSWKIQPVGLATNYGEDVDLVLDQQNRPHLAYRVEVLTTTPSIMGLGYSWCRQDCESAAASWQHALVDSEDALNTTDPVPLKTGCTLQSWVDVGMEASLALDPQGKAVIGYNTIHTQSGGSCGSITIDIKLARIALNIPSPDTIRYYSFLPLAIGL